MFSVCVHAEHSKEVQRIQKATSNMKYILCIDGGGSKTTLHIIDSQGIVQELTSQGQVVEMTKGGCGNINFVGKEGMKITFHQLFDDLEIHGVPISELSTQCAIVTGMGGLGAVQNQEAVCELLEDFGFLKEHIVPLSDAALSLEVVGEKGIILISGTGCIAFGRDGGETKRVGGFGKLIDDSPSGYGIGQFAIKSTLEEEQGYGTPTLLTKMIKEHFKVDRIYDIVVPIHSNEIGQDQIASLSKGVFEAARQGDIVANKIIAKTAKKLGLVLRNLLMLLQKEIDYNVYLIGGLFLDESANAFIEMIKNTKALLAHLQENRQEICFHNIADRPGALFAMQKILEHLGK